MAVDTSIIGKSTGTTRVVVERGPVAVFADAVKDRSPIYKDAGAAAAAGYDQVPAPPTYPFVMSHWGAFTEMQPEGGGDAMAGIGAVLGPLMAQGGLILHGEQAFEYHRPVVVGDVLVGEGKVVDVYEKESGSHSMTFLVTETTWTDESSGQTVATARTNLLVRR
ncbi:MAG TPA: MaoC family dehydratase N-terminal domain-containing protein [Acidimicrobiales bacterium]|jgi:acyl dehydratase|nr:MaoC family dehydratase N-terminal domain-containing protein [Acidimicrobiales bacterium]